MRVHRQAPPVLGARGCIESWRTDLAFGNIQQLDLESQLQCSTATGILTKRNTLKGMLMRRRAWAHGDMCCSRRAHMPASEEAACPTGLACAADGPSCSSTARSRGLDAPRAIRRRCRTVVQQALQTLAMCSVMLSSRHGHSALGFQVFMQPSFAAGSRDYAAPFVCSRHLAALTCSGRGFAARLTSEEGPAGTLCYSLSLQHKGHDHDRAHTLSHCLLQQIVAPVLLISIVSYPFCIFPTSQRYVRGAVSVGLFVQQERAVRNLHIFVVGAPMPAPISRDWM